MCDHEIAVRRDGNVLITYCRKCGKILDSSSIKEPTNEEVKQEKTTIILHD